MVTQAIAEVMNVGDHGSTFAGNPLVCHAAEAVVDIITEEGFLEDVTRKGEKLRAGLEKALGSNSHVKQVRGLGLIVGVQLDVVRRSPAGFVCTSEVQCICQMTVWHLFIMPR
jgi:acetylornithine aminotransferase